MPPLRNTGSAPEAERPDYAGRYLLESALGSGGMGVVHLATSASGLRLAVKVIHTNHASDPEFRARFRQEVAAARQVSGAFTAPVVDADPEAERPWMATLFIDGPTLSERVKRNGPLSTEELVRLGAGLAEGLRDIHRAGVVHRDLKPSNVLLAADGPKVIDFGISRPKDSVLRTETGKLIGTPPFMAPEQFQRPREVGPAADVFAMGAVLVHAATGRGPFDSDSPYIVAYQVVHNEPDLAGVPEQLLTLITRCLAKEPDDRPTPDELMTALRTPHVPRVPPQVPPQQGVTALVPAQRGGGPGAVVTSPTTATHPKSPRNHGDRTGGDQTGGDRNRGGRNRGGGLGTVRSASGPRRYVRRVAVGGVLLAVATAGFVVVRASEDGAGAAQSRTERAAQKFRPWDVTLSGGEGKNRMPVCSADGASVYCTAPGVKAARINSANGHVDWSVKDERATADPDQDAAPFLSGGLLHVVTPGGTHLEALDPASGAKRWDVGISSYAAVRHVGDTVLLMTDDGRVRSLDGATGNERWTERRGGAGAVWMSADGSGGTKDASGADGAGGTDGASGAGGAGGALFAATPSPDGATTEVSSVDPASGALRWRKQLKGTLIPAGATAKGKGTGDALFLLATDADGYTDAVLRVDEAGRVVRRVQLSVPVDQAQATFAGNTVYVVGYAGSLLAVDMSADETGADDTGAADTSGADTDADDTSGGGTEKAGSSRGWRLETSVTRASRPTVAGNHVYLSAGDGRLLAVDAERGRLVGQTKTRMNDGRYTFSGTLPAPVTAPGKVFATAPDGSVFAATARDPASW
ncbi:protein kinase [Streptomyces sp. NPDC088400]|uniref:protein kinase domain-containing protein n=1 Tax=Streptomyces sp. NPDC088400 TaxID=3365861 RepID=UPI0038140232